MWRQGPGSLVFFLAQQSGPAVWSDQILRRSEREAEVASFKQSYRNVTRSSLCLENHFARTRCI